MMGRKLLIHILFLLALLTSQGNGQMSKAEIKQIWYDTGGQTIELLIEIGVQEICWKDVVYILEKITKFKEFEKILQAANGLAKILETISDQDRVNIAADYLNNFIVENVLNKDIIMALKEHKNKFKNINTALEGAMYLRSIWGCKSAYQIVVKVLWILID
uniref:Uncharacterized protein n=1 Tax=Clytia hemisphaerica TaxID=252671 RepID=A0A7M5V7H8_9CNID